MHRDDPDIIIRPRQGPHEKALPEQALFFVNPYEANLAFEQFLGNGGRERKLYNSRLAARTGDSLCLAGPALGAAAAVLVLEKLIVLGVKKIVLVSCCGAVAPALSVGDFVIATHAVCGEGVSRYYGATSVTRPDTELEGAIGTFLQAAAADWQSGVLWSTDAPYRERRSELFSLQEKFGVIAVDMELSGLCAAAAFRGVKLGGLFVVSDELWGPAWKPGFTDPRYRERSRWLIERLVCNGLDF